jgi:hypothetical protein
VHNRASRWNKALLDNAARPSGALVYEPGDGSSLSSVTIRLTNVAQLLLNADPDALMAGANLALVGEELIQFGRADQLGPGLYRLSRLLRGRRGTEWAAMSHAVGDCFRLIDAAIRPIDLNASAVGASLAATAHGIADAAPLPTVQRLISGEAMRPPSPCHLKVVRDGNRLAVRWVRRSHKGWSWIDGLGVGDDAFAERYRLSARGPLGELVTETAETNHDFTAAEMPGVTGQAIAIAVATIGSAALSHDTHATITL